MNLYGKKVVITGGGKRVGCALARAFAARGALVTVHCHHSEPEARALLAELGGEAAGHSLLVCDLTERETVTRLAPRLFSGVSVLVNNASVFVRRKFGLETEEEAASQWAVNFDAPVHLMRLFARYGERPGVILNLLDQGICRPDENSFSYALSKKALGEATKAAALQLAPDIRVNALAPGPMLPPPDMPESRMEKTLRTLPLRRPVALEDLCSGAVFLTENESVTGSVLFIDCGQSLGQSPRSE